MAFLIELRPNAEPTLVECADGGFTREQAREIMGGDYMVVPTYVADLVLLLCGEAEEGENVLATEMLSVTNNDVIYGRALLARVVKNRVAGLAPERAEYWMRNLKE